MVLLVALALVCLVTIGYAAATSTTAFGPYTATWEGTSELRSMADVDDRSLVVARNTTAYSDTPANETVAFVLAPDAEYGAADATRVQEFLDSGGTLVVAEASHPAANELLANVGASTRIDGDPLRDETNHGPTPDFPVTEPNASHALLEGVDTVVLNHGSALIVDNNQSTVLLASSRYGYLDRDFSGSISDNETLGTYPVAAIEPVGDGQVVVVSDPSVFINEQLPLGDNRAFLTNLLTGHATVIVDISHGQDLPPLALALLTLRASFPLQVVLIGLALAGVWAGFRTRTPHRLREALGRTNPTTLPQAYDPTALRQHLERRHPDWDPDRIERVVAATGDESAYDNSRSRSADD